MSTLYGMQRLEQITSPANALVKDVKKAASTSSTTADGCCVAEGFHLLLEALSSEASIVAVLVRPEVAVLLPPLPLSSRIIELPRSLFDSVASTGTSQGVLALVRLPQWREKDLLQAPGLVVILDGVQDPGNAGTIVRTAEAFGATGIVFGNGSARPGNPKTLRASAGSLFRMPFLEVGRWKPSALRMLGAMPFSPATTDIDQVDFTQPCAIVVGSEGRGISEAYQGIEQIAIPTAGVESLNAAVAASILLYEAHRQRSRATR